jgi:hypothetical protein
MLHGLRRQKEKCQVRESSWKLEIPASDGALNRSGNLTENPLFLRRRIIHKILPIDAPIKIKTTAAAVVNIAMTTAAL